MTPDLYQHHLMTGNGMAMAVISNDGNYDFYHHLTLMLVTQWGS